MSPEEVMRVHATLRTAVRYAAALSMGMILFCGESFPEDQLSASSTIGGCRNYISSSKNDLFLQGYCAGAVEACAPKGATNMQSVRIVLQYIDARPTRMHENFNKIAADALRHTWPCSN